MCQTGVGWKDRAVRTSLNVEVGIDIERPPAEVWAMVSDFTRLPEWLGEFEEVACEGDTPGGKGAVFRYRLGPGPGEREGLVELVEWARSAGSRGTGRRCDRVSAARDRAGPTRS